jgi:hypothetical protein
MRLATCQEFQPNDDTIFREIVRLKIAHLRRMADTAAAWAILSASKPGVQSLGAYMLTPRKFDKLRRFHSACLAKIAELKGSQCSTKS